MRTPYIPDKESLVKASYWMARLWADEPSAQEHKACKAWRNADPSNENAWQYLMNAQAKFGGVPPNTTNILSRSRQLSRRSVLGLAGTVTGGLFFAGGYQLNTEENQFLAESSGKSELTTDKGEIKHIILSDGSLLNLNTATDISMPNTHRLLLNSGEFLLNSHSPIPYQIETPAGHITLYAGQLNVRHTDNHTSLSLYEGKPALLIGHNMDNTVTLKPGNHIDFDSTHTENLQPTDTNTISWVIGKLVVQDMPLPKLINELSRYRKGVLRISPDLSHLTVSGVFTLKNTDTILKQLQASLPINVTKFTNYWVNVTPA